MGFILRVLVVALGLWLASALVPGIQVEDGWTLVGAALLLGIVNALVRPLLVILTLPITILTLGLFLLVINAAMLGLVASFFDGFVISSFWSALLGAMIVSLTGWVVSWYIGSRGQVEVIFPDAGASKRVLRFSVRPLFLRWNGGNKGNSKGK